jgi:hypothetical protein
VSTIKEIICYDPAVARLHSFADDVVIGTHCSYPALLSRVDAMVLSTNECPSGADIGEAFIYGTLREARL